MMRFKRLELNNWRSFLGNCVIDFAQTRERNVTVFVGQNGAGKTALLNAFTWALYGETTAGFRQPDDLFNHAALGAIPPGGSGRVEVRLEFGHEGADYTVRRFQEAHRDEVEGAPRVQQPVLVATRRRSSAEAITQDEINAILPPGLHPFFFFPAENIGRDIDQNDAAAIRASMSNAIDVLLGIERYDTALAVISTALGQHLKTPRGARHTALDESEAESKRAREAWEKANARKKQLPGKIKEAEALVDKLKAQLDTSAQHREAMDEVKKVEAGKAEADRRVSDSEEQQRAIANRECAVIFGHELFADASKVLDEAYRRGEIPPKISAGLLNELLDKRAKCICGRELGENERSKLEALRSRTVEDFVAEIASNLRGRARKLAWRDEARRDEEAAKALLDAVRARADAEAEFRKLRNREMELTRQPEVISHADPDRTMAAWRKGSRELDRLNFELQAAAAELPKLERARNDAERDHQKALKKNTDAQTIGRAREILSNVEFTLSTIRNKLRAAARTDVERAMNRFYGPLLMKDYRISLTDEFRYEITDQSSGRRVGASSSEVALATFAFVGALAGLMPTYADIDQLLPKGDDQSPGGLDVDASRAYPVVLDAPYSPFGADYSERFSKNLPKLLPQSVVIVREDQLEYVKPMLAERQVGAAYVIQLQSGIEKSRTIRWLNYDVDYVVNTDNQEAPHSKIASLPLE